MVHIDRIKLLLIVEKLHLKKNIIKVAIDVRIFQLIKKKLFQTLHSSLAIVELHLITASLNANILSKHILSISQNIYDFYIFPPMFRSL